MIFPVAILLSSLTQLSIPFRVHPSIVAIYAIGLTYAVIAVPFIVSGIIVCLSLTGYVSRVSRLYAADLAGAALGCVLLIPIIGWSDAATAVLWVAALAATGGIAFTRASGSRGLRVAAVSITAVLVIAAAGHTALVWRQFPVFRIIYVKGDFEARPLYEKWNSYSRVRVNGDAGAEVLPQGWGLSRTLPADIRVRQLQMDIDVAAGTVMTGFAGDLSAVRHLKYDVTNIGYHLRPGGDALVIGAGGGRDVLSALSYGASSVTAVEINKDILRTVNGRFGDFTGHLDRDPRVRFVNDEARSYIAGSPQRYDDIQISLIDTWAATAAGAFVLSENSLYTVEAWTTFLSRLTDDGVLSVSRWYFRDRPDEVYRTTTLAVEALGRIGVQDPRKHLAIVRNMRIANRADLPDGVGTLLVSRAPLTDPEIAALEQEAQRLEFEVVFSPRHSADPMFERLTAGGDLAALLDAHATNISAPTDDSPFFFNMLRLRDVFRLDLLEAGKQTHNVKAVATLALLLMIVTVLTAAVHRAAAVVDAASHAAARSGTAVHLLHRHRPRFHADRDLADAAADHRPRPSHLRAVGRAVRAAAVERGRQLSDVGPDAATVARAGRVRLIVLLLVLAVFGVATPPIVHAIEPASTLWRIATSVAVLFPIGLMMGMAFPIGMKIAADRERGADALVLGPERRRLGALIGPQRVHRPDLVDLHGVLGRIHLLRRGPRGVHRRRPPSDAILRLRSMAKRALITGITGQDGSYLAELLLKGLRGRRRRPALQCAEPLAHRPPARSHRAPARGPARPALADQGARRCQADRGLQPRGHVVRAGVVGPADADRRIQRAGRNPGARGNPPGGSRDPRLSGVLQRDVREGARGPADGADAVLSAQPVRRLEGVRALHHGQLPREL